jgi:hypothetical protein
LSADRFRQLSERATATRHLVSPRYFSTLGIPLRSGRDFDERDNTRVPDVVIINETFARSHFPVRTRSVARSSPGWRSGRRRSLAWSLISAARTLIRPRIRNTFCRAAAA